MIPSLRLRAQSWVWFMHPEEQWLPGKTARGFRPGETAEVTLEDGSVRAGPALVDASPPAFSPEELRPVRAQWAGAVGKGRRERAPSRRLPG